MHTYLDYFPLSLSVSHRRFAPKWKLDGFHCNRNERIWPRRDRYSTM